MWRGISGQMSQITLQVGDDHLLVGGEANGLVVQHRGVVQVERAANGGHSQTGLSQQGDDHLLRDRQTISYASTNQSARLQA